MSRKARKSSGTRNAKAPGLNLVSRALRPETDIAFKMKRHGYPVLPGLHTHPTCLPILTLVCPCTHMVHPIHTQKHIPLASTNKHKYTNK